MTLARLADLTSIEILDHLDRSATIPIIDGFSAQGDLIVIPARYATDITLPWYVRWREVPPAGIELLRGGAGGNTHTLVADPGTCEWTSIVDDRLRLALGLLRASAPVYLIHAEHGGVGIAPGEYLIRRQRQAAVGRPRWSGAAIGSAELVCD